MSIINFKFLTSLLHCKDYPWVKAQYIVHLTSYYFVHSQSLLHRLVYFLV